MKRRTFLSTVLAGIAGAQRAFGYEEQRPTINGLTYQGPKVTQILVDKNEKVLHLLHGRKPIKTYDVKFGFQPKGHKTRRGDGKTPEGLYHIDRRNYQSNYYLSLGISYPNANDRAMAAARGVHPGGDIFIHGGPRTAKDRKRVKKDWTAGCISVTDTEMREIFWMVEIGTPIYIKP